MNSAHHASGVVKAIGSFLFGVDVRFEEQDVQGDFTEATYIFLLMNDFMDFHAGFSFMYPHVPKIAPYCPTPSDTPLAEPRILQWPCKGLANGLGTFTRRRFAKSNHLCLVGSLNTYDHYRIPDEFQQFILHNVIMSASQGSAAFWEFCKARWPSNESGPTMRFNEKILKYDLTLMHWCWEEVEILQPHQPERSRESRIWTRQSQTHQPVPGPKRISTSSVGSEILAPQPSPSFAWMHSVLWHCRYL